MPRLLFIDDDPEIRSLYHDRLQTLGSVTTCENGSLAMALLQKDHNFDVIICDYCMPIKNGGDVWGFIQHLGLKIPFVLFTSRSLKELPEFDESFHSAGNIWLQKPISPEKLLKTIRAVSGCHQPVFN
ncbi:MAG: hypothetical protein A2X86_22360 [Bdellovibrionales bacterium GWA2_49_15]|nr:MAG: hypothetical protein A2X86_22360 [Bdellovibrionales bacterium GWA2_49_15]HAZ14777.1 hypothetical protein [Bdellovibrionales bacterium]